MPSGAPTPADPFSAWHTIPADAVARKLGVDPKTGLTPPEAAARLHVSGFNSLAETPSRPAWRLFLTQFASALILVLIAASGLAATIGHYRDALVIMGVVTLNALLGFYQEYRAECSLNALRTMLPRYADVRRNGLTMRIPAETLVVGDIVQLEAGDRIPADGRLLFAADLAVDESTLTGESQPAGKQTSPLPAAREIPLAECNNMVWMNTLATRGRAGMIVTATGVQTRIGQISTQLAAGKEPPSPLSIQLDQLGKRLGLLALVLVILLFLLQLARCVDVTHALLDAVALAVAAIPEGLPVVVTITLALGMNRMARHRAIVKRLASVETLGCTTVICTDKTGTLTRNRMSVREFIYRGQPFTISGTGQSAVIHAEDTGQPIPDFTPLLMPLIACNDSRFDGTRIIGDPTETALLELAGIAHPGVLPPPRRIAEIPFDSDHKFMATFHHEGAHVLVYAKGAPDILLPRCKTCLDETGAEQALDQSHAARISDSYASLASRGLRGLLVARRRIEKAAFRPDGLSVYLDDLVFIGLLGLADPPRPEAAQAIARCRDAGVKVKMITGDHPRTAMAIGAELGLGGNTLTGPELDRLDTPTLAGLIDDVDVFARTTPHHKVRIVQALQARGHIVAMTGDGVNDAPALKIADIGIAMGESGSEVAREAAGMILTDDNFATIVSAIDQGRTLYDNILKFIRFQLSTTIGALLTIFIAPLASLPEPFNPIQILWVAMIMDGPPAISLALDSARRGIMNDPPRQRSEPVLPWPRLARILAFGIIMMLGTLAMLHHGLHSGMDGTATTLAFTTFVLFQVFNVFNARNERHTALGAGFFSNTSLWLSVMAVLCLQVIAVCWPPAQPIFGTVPLSLRQWLECTAIASTILWLEELRKILAFMLGRSRAKHSNHA